MNNLVDKDKIEDPLTYKIIGCAMKVHAALGNGFQEVIYQRALAIEFRNAQVINFGARSLEVKRLRHPRNKMSGTIPKIQ